MSISRSSRARVAIGGLGAVGMEVVRRLRVDLGGLTLTAVSARDRVAARDRLARMDIDVPVLPLADLAETADVVVECAPASVFEELVEPAVAKGRTVIAISVGALLRSWSLVDSAREHGAQIVVPSGALLGLDAVRAAAEEGIHSVRMVTRKPPSGLAGAPYLEEHGIGLDDVTQPREIFEGSARDGAKGFPANVNVAAALALAGVGPDRTRLEIWADPTVDRNTHEVFVEAETARFTLRIENVPSAENPRTGRIVAGSVIATLRRLIAPLTIGT